MRQRIYYILTVMLKQNKVSKCTMIKHSGIHTINDHSFISAFLIFLVKATLNFSGMTTLDELKMVSHREDRSEEGVHPNVMALQSLQ